MLLLPGFLIRKILTWIVQFCNARLSKSTCSLDVVVGGMPFALDMVRNKTPDSFIVPSLSIFGIYINILISCRIFWHQNVRY